MIMYIHEYGVNLNKKNDLYARFVKQLAQQQ